MREEVWERRGEEVASTCALEVESGDRGACDLEDGLGRCSLEVVTNPTSSLLYRPRLAPPCVAARPRGRVLLAGAPPHLFSHSPALEGGSAEQLVEDVGLFERRRDVEVVVGPPGGDAPSRRPRHEALLDEVRLVDLLDGPGVLADGHGNGSRRRPGRRRTSPSRTVRMRASMSSKPASSTSRALRAWSATAWLTRPSPGPAAVSTSAKSRVRRNSLFAMRGVPRLLRRNLVRPLDHRCRRPSRPALRSTIWCSVSTS